MSALTAGRNQDSHRATLRRAGEHALFGLLPLVAFVLLVRFELRDHAVAVDFRSGYYAGAEHLLHAVNPYADTHAQLITPGAFVYPAFAALALSPLALLGRELGGFLFAAMCVACVPAILGTLRVRDWRVYGAAMLWLPVFSAWQSANLTLPLVLGVALVWRHRERPLVAGLIAALAISLKPLVWPLGLWLLATRRFRAAAWALGTGLVLNVASWLLLGVSTIPSYLHLVGVFTRRFEGMGYSVIALAHYAGLGRTAGEILLLVASLCLAAGVLAAGVLAAGLRQGQERALVLAVALMLVASPLIWSHYFALLLIPMALGRRRLSALWLAPVLMWVCPASTATVGWEAAVAWAVTLVCFAGAWRGLDTRRAASRRHEPQAARASAGQRLRAAT